MQVTSKIPLTLFFLILGFHLTCQSAETLPKHKVIFCSLKSGKFVKGSFTKANTEIKKNFEIADIEVTQYIWRSVAKKAATEFPKKYLMIADATLAENESKLNKIKGSPSAFPGDDRPVDSVSYNEIQVWLQALNDLSEASAPLLNDLFEGHKSGSLYRLPTDDEWEYTARNQGKSRDAFPEGVTEATLPKFVVYDEPARTAYGTEDVMSREPIIVNGVKLYDLLGNVWEWTSDSVGERKIIRGGAWSISSTDVFKLGYKSESQAENHDYFLGFRLVREVKTP